MKDIVTKTMDEIDEECREVGYYPDLIELFEMAMARLNQEDRYV